MADPVSKGIASAVLDAPARQALAGPQDRFLSDGALAAAQMPRPAPPRGISLSFPVDGEPMNLQVTPESIGDFIFIFYTVGRWPWVHALLDALGEHLDGPASRMGTATQRRELSSAYLPAAGEGLKSLNAQIETVLVAVFESVLDHAIDKAPEKLLELDLAEARYGIVPFATTFNSGKQASQPSADGTSGGTPLAGDESTAANSPADGDGDGDASGTPGAADEPPDDETVKKAYAEALELVDAIKQLFALQSAIETASVPHQALRDARNPPHASFDSPPPRPDPKAIEREEGVLAARIAPAVEAFAAKLREHSQKHPIIGGVFGVLCAGTDAGATASGNLDGDEAWIHQLVYRSATAYLAQAREALSTIPGDVSIDMSRRGNAQREGRGLLADLNVVVDDTPEMNAALWAARSDKPDRFDPLDADELLQLIRNDIARDARGRSEEALLQTSFTMSVIESYREGWFTSRLVGQARLLRAEKPLARYDKSSALLSLLGLLVAPELAIPAGAIGLYSMFYHGVNQYEAFNYRVGSQQSQALQALLADDALAQARALANRPSGFAEIASAAASIVFDQVIMRLPGVGAWYAARQDVLTLLEND